MLQTLTTPRGETLSGTPWQVYPRPQMRRDSYINLNGEWDFAVSSGKPETFDMRITVPFCPESRLSGIGRHFEEGAPLWYRRRFLLPEGFRRKRVLLHIGAADQIAEVFVNGQYLCRHEGGYASFCVDITEALAEENELVIRCTDDLHDQAFPHVRPDDLREELKKIRQDGYAITHGEYVTDALGIGAPVFNSDGELAGSIGIIAPEIRVDTPEFLDTQKDLVQFYASSLSADLGYEKHDVFQ